LESNMEWYNTTYTPGRENELPAIKATQSIMWFKLRSLSHKRIFPGFRIAEVFAWFLFHLGWPLMLAFIYQVTGKFADKNYMTAPEFFRVQSFVIAGKAIFLLPFWWLFFVRLKETALGKKMMLHILTGLMYTVLCLALFYLLLTNVMHFDYTWPKILGDVYNLMVTYFLNFALFHAYNFWLDTQKQMKKQQELKELAYQSEIMALKAQIEPHFLFNTLNSISASVPSTLEKTRILIAQLADTFRYALRVSERDTVSLAEEIAFVKTWLSLEKHRFGERLSIHYSIDEVALTAQIPPLILQPLIENALKHGISPNVGGGTVSIACMQIAGFVHIGVTDTGEGLGDEPGMTFTKGIGLKNTARRLEHLYNEKLTVTQMRNGLCFSFKIPAKL
ncbi:MAG: hypothetical protein EOO04_18420, partial [Chitinophagaceae bacterium]